MKDGRYTDEDVNKWLRLAGKVGATCTGAVNWFLSAVFFFIATGTLEMVFGNIIGYWSTIIAAILLGFGLVIVEAIINVISKQKGEISTPHYLIILLLVAVNIGAGIYRSSANALEKSNDAKIQAQNDPRWKGLQNDREAQNEILENNYGPDDAGAQNRLREIAAEENVIVREYAAAAHVNNRGQIFYWILSIALVLVNIGFSISVKAATPMVNEPKFKNIGDRIAGNHKAKYPKKNIPAPVTAGFNASPLTIQESEQQKTFLTKANLTKKNNKETRKEKLKIFLESRPEATLAEMADAIGVNSRETVRKYLSEMGL